MDRPSLSEAQEDYLKALLLLELEEGRPASTQALAQRLGVRPPSVTEMLKKLAGLGLVQYTPYQGASLSPLGRQIALKILRHHRLGPRHLGEHPGRQAHLRRRPLQGREADRGPIRPGTGDVRGRRRSGGAGCCSGRTSPSGRLT